MNEVNSLLRGLASTNFTLPSEQLKILGVFSLGFQQFLSFFWSFLFVLFYIHKYWSRFNIQSFFLYADDPLFKDFRDALKQVFAKVIVSAYALMMYSNGLRIVTTGSNHLDMTAVVFTFIVSTDYSHMVYKFLGKFVPSKAIAQIAGLVTDSRTEQSTTVDGGKVTTTQTSTQDVKNKKTN